MRIRIAILGGLLTVAAVACSVVDEGKVERIDPQFGLDDTLPSSTSIATTTTQLATTTTGLETPTTVVATEQVRLYFVTSGQLSDGTQTLASPVTFAQIIFALQLGPPEDLAGGRTIVPSDAEIRVTTDGSGVASVTLPEGFFELIPDPANNQRLVIAQLVLTITSSRGIGQVTFNQAVPLPNGGVRAPGQQLSFSDYRIYTSSNSDVVTEPTVPAATTTTTNG